MTQSHSKEVIGKCPVCGRDVVTGRLDFFCVGRLRNGRRFEEFIRDRCLFSIYHEQLKRLGKEVITPEEMRTLLAGGKIRLENLKGKSGKVFSCYGLLSCKKGFGWGVEFDFSSDSSGMVTHHPQPVRRVRPISSTEGNAM
jgi:DNA topoisomerase III